MAKKKYTRLAFDFENSAVEKLDKIVNETGVKDRAEVLRNALILYSKTIEAEQIRIQHINAGSGIN